MIRETMTIHDRFQFELKESYNLSRDSLTDSYHIKTYFFVPRNLNIGKETYSKEDFYKDIKTNIRLETPALHMATLASDIDLFHDLQKAVDTVESNPGKESDSQYEIRFKLFCLMLKKSMGIQLKFIDQADKENEARYLSEELVASITKVSTRFRSMAARIDSSRLTEQQKSLYRFSDEYMSLKIESQCYLLLESLKKKYSSLYVEINRVVLDMIAGETSYRREQGYPTIVDREGDNEKFLFHQSALKKFLHNILFLDLRTDRSEKFVEQILYSIAAGIAMIFATAVVVIGQSRYDTITMPFFIALVVSYMFKDRIKDLLRLFFYLQIQKWFYDREKNIYHRFDERIGKCKESFNVIRDDQLPDMIMAYRARDRLTDINNSMTGENVILYRKYITFNRKKFSRIKEEYQTNGIIDLVRFNVQNFIKYMDDPEKKIFITQGTEYSFVSALRVYHINIITHFSDSNKDYLKRFRVVLNREGIKRIEEVY